MCFIWNSDQDNGFVIKANLLAVYMKLCDMKFYLINESPPCAYFGVNSCMPIVPQNTSDPSEMFASGSTIYLTETVV